MKRFGVKTLAAGICVAVAVLLADAPLWAGTDGLGGKDVIVDVQPTQLVLGEHSFARVDIHLPPEADSYDVRAVRGTVDSIRRSGDIVFASYHPPKDYVPAFDVIAVRATHGGKTFYGYATLPLHGQGRADIRTAPRAQATLRIGKRVFGPVRADARGEARISVVVPPGVTQGFDDEDNVIDLGVPKVTRTALFAFQDEVRRDETLELFCVVVSPDGGAPHAWVPSIEVEGGEVKEILTIGGGACTAEVTASTSASVLEIRAELKDVDDVPFELALPIVEPPQPPPPQEKEAAPPAPKPEIKALPPREVSSPQVTRLRSVSVGGAGAAFLGAGTNFGTLNGFQGGLELEGGVGFGGHQLLIGGLGSLLYGRADSAVERFGQGSKGDSEDLIVQLLGALGYRTWFGNTLGIELKGHLGAALSRHMMEAEIVKDAEQSFRVAEQTGGWSLAAGAGARLLWDISTGFLFLGGRYLWIADDDHNQSLSLMSVDAGWGMEIGF